MFVSFHFLYLVWMTTKRGWTRIYKKWTNSDPIFGVTTMWQMDGWTNSDCMLLANLLCACVRVCPVSLRVYYLVLVRPWGAWQRRDADDWMLKAAPLCLSQLSAAATLVVVLISVRSSSSSKYKSVAISSLSVFCFVFSAATALTSFAKFNRWINTEAPSFQGPLSVRVWIWRIQETKQLKLKNVWLF